MADNQSQLEILIKTIAETQGIQLTREQMGILQQQLGKATRDTVSGPIEIGLPPEAPAHITAATEAWNGYAEARAKVLAAQNTPETVAGEQEKRLANELKLIHEVLAAEKEKALVDLELAKGQMTPDAYEAARSNIQNIFGEAGTKADQENRRKQVANMQAEASSLELDAHNKMNQALAIKLAPGNVAAANQKYLDDQAAMASSALKQINERIALINRQANPDAVADYAGPMGLINKRMDAGLFHFRYGDWATTQDAMGIEQTRKAQAEALIDTAENYKSRQSAAQKRRDDLTRTAGEENARAAGIRSQIPIQKDQDARQAAVDQFTAGLHRESTAKIIGANAETARAVQEHTAAVLSVFDNIAATLRDHDRRLSQQASQLAHHGP